MSDTFEFTQLELAKNAISTLDNRIREIEDRQRLIPGRLDVQRSRLGEALAEGLDASDIYAEIEKLERETRQLDAQALALAGPYKRAEQILKQAQAEAARERYHALNEELLPYPEKIFKLLDAAYSAARKMTELQAGMVEARDIAGRLAPIPEVPSADIIITRGIPGLIRQAWWAVLTENVEVLQKKGYSLEAK